MKKLFLALSLLLAVSVSSVFANEGATVNEQVQAAFKKEFPAASLIEWNNPGEYYKATFMLWGHRTEAYFTEDGQLQGSIRSLFYNQLPLAIMTSVDKRFEGAEILDVNEINNSNGTTYSLLLEVGSRKYRVKANATGGITEVNKLKKNI
jgi:hypothetical protein